MKRLVIKTIPWLLLLIIKTVSSAESDFWILTSLEPPFTQLNERGKLEGYAVDVVQQVLHEAGVEQTILAAPWERVFKEANTKENVLVFALARTAQREELFYWITPITSNRVAILSLNKNAQIVSKPEQLDKTLSYGVLDGDFRHKILLDLGIANIVVLDTWENGLKLLLADKLDNVFYSSIGMQSICRRMELACQDITSVFAFDPVDGYLALSKQSDIQTVERLQQAALRLKASQAFENKAKIWVKDYQKKFGLSMHLKDGKLNFWSEPVHN